MKTENTTKRIKHISELPDWFNLAKYEFTKNLDALGWFKQLVTRGAQFIKAGKISSDIVIDPAHKKIISIIRINPNVTIDNDTAFSMYDPIRENNGYQKLEKNFGVYPVKIKSASTKLPFDIYQVDYNFTDEFLIESFKRCLTTARKKHKSSYHAPYRKADFMAWTKLGILPYIDLLMWSMEEKKHITHRVLASALYPDGDKGEETIRKTTAPLVEEILSPYSMMQLHAQAAICIVEKNSK